MNRNQDKPLILISNDDGILAKGINELIEIIKPYGNIVVIAPDSAMSGMSNAITSEVPITVNKVWEEESCTKYSCSGTPTDCIKMGFYSILDRKPDFVLSGINHGSNASINVVYSGTMGIALEGCIHEVPSIAFSLCDSDDNADFSNAKPWIEKIFKQVIINGLPKHVCLNVNIPKGQIKGIEVRRQSHGIWDNEIQKRINPRGKDYYWLAGSFTNLEKDANDTDLNAIENGFISIVPTKIDVTSHQTISEIKNWKF